MYLKKRKMYDLCNHLMLDLDLFQLVGCNTVPGLRDCEYKFYRGSEWLHVYFGDLYVVLYHGNSYISIEILNFDDNSSVHRKVFCGAEYLSLCEVKDEIKYNCWI